MDKEDFRGIEFILIRKFEETFRLLLIGFPESSDRSRVAKSTSDQTTVYPAKWGIQFQILLTVVFFSFNQIFPKVQAVEEIKSWLK